MSISGTKSVLSAKQLLRTVAQLSWDEFNEFLGRAASLRPTPPSTPRLARRETALLLKINEGPPPQWQAACNRLVEKRRTGRLSAAEEKQLRQSVEKMEGYDVKRMEWLVELAALRKMPLRALIKSLGLKTPAYV